MVATPRSNGKIQKLPTEEWGCDFADEAPEELIVSGREGYNETMNGRYQRGDRLHEGRVFYSHTERKFVIRWCPAKRSWFFDWRGLNTDTTASAALAQDIEHPHLATQAWRVFDGKKWISDAKLALCATIEKKQSEGEHVDFSEINGCEEGTSALTGGVSV